MFVRALQTWEELREDLLRVCKEVAFARREGRLAGGGEEAPSLHADKKRPPELEERCSLWGFLSAAARLLLKMPVEPLPSLLVRFAAARLQDEEQEDAALETATPDSAKPASVERQKDGRVCLLCKGRGNRFVTGPLVPVSSFWAHAQCVLWAVPSEILPQTASDEFRALVEGRLEGQSPLLLAAGAGECLPFASLPSQLPPARIPAALVLKAASEASRSLCEICGLRGAFVCCATNCGGERPLSNMGMSSVDPPLGHSSLRGPSACLRRAHLRCLLQRAAEQRREGRPKPLVFFSLRRFLCASCCGGASSGSAWSGAFEGGGFYRALSSLSAFASRDPLFVALEGMAGGVALSLLRFLKQSVFIAPLAGPVEGEVSQTDGSFSEAFTNLPEALREQPAVVEVQALLRRLEGSLGEETSAEGGSAFLSPQIVQAFGGRRLAPVVSLGGEDCARRRRRRRLSAKHSVLRCGGVSLLSLGWPLLVEPSSTALHPLGFASVRRFWKVAAPVEIHAENCPLRGEGVDGCFTDAEEGPARPRWKRASYLCSVSAHRGRALYTLDLLAEPGPSLTQEGVCEACAFGWRVSTSTSPQEAVRTLLALLQSQVEEAARTRGETAAEFDWGRLRVDAEEFFGLSLRFVQRRAKALLLATLRTRALAELHGLVPRRDPARE